MQSAQQDIRLASLRTFSARECRWDDPGAARSASLRACPWLPSFAPLAHGECNLIEALIALTNYDTTTARKKVLNILFE